MRMRTEKEERGGRPIYVLDRNPGHSTLPEYECSRKEVVVFAVARASRNGPWLGRIVGPTSKHRRLFVSQELSQRAEKARAMKIRNFVEAFVAERITHPTLTVIANT
ncbi:unnamed protein product [Mortierella alpina]